MPSAANAARQPSVSSAPSSDNDEPSSTDPNGLPSKENGASSQILSAPNPEGDMPSSSDSIAPRPEDETEPHPLLQSRDHMELLDTVDDLRKGGISHHIELPQIVVCGDQSAGKSSVLEAVSGVRFPTESTLCTRFATVLSLRRSPKTDIKVFIEPSKHRSNVDRQHVAHFRFNEPSLNDIGGIIDQAKRAMGIGYGKKSFSNDVLRLEVSGPRQPHLTLIDIPGVFHSTSQEQSREDMEIVAGIVNSYMENPRSIILAVVSAQNDHNNQIILTMARRWDPQGQRTLGIITKPDTLPVDSPLEAKFFKLANNEEVSFRLGWHILKNRKYEERDTTAAQRDASEREFFSRGRWSNLSGKLLGIGSLTPKLSEILKRQIISELPNLKRDVQIGIDDCLQRLAELGPERRTLTQQRAYLGKISEKCTSIIKDAVEGTYIHEFFSETGEIDEYSKRLRAVLQVRLSEFESEMQSKGHAIEIIEDGQPHNTMHPKIVTRTNFVNRDAREALQRTRGLELPGLVNPLFVGDLFYRQSKPWAQLANTHRIKILEAVRLFFDQMMNFVADETTREGMERHIIRTALDKYASELETKVGEILRPHQRGHLITHNQEFATNVRAIRKRHVRQQMAERLFSVFGFESEKQLIEDANVNVETLLNVLANTSEQDMEYYACSEATDCMQAYYKAALHLFVDNFAVLAIETSLVEKLGDIFTSQIVMELDDKTVSDIAAESKVSQEERDRVNDKLESLRKGMSILRNMELHSGSTNVTSSQPVLYEADMGQPNAVVQPASAPRRVSATINPPAAAPVPTNPHSNQQSFDFGQPRAESTPSPAPRNNGLQHGVNGFGNAAFTFSQPAEPGLFPAAVPNGNTGVSTTLGVEALPFRSQSSTPRRKSRNGPSTSPSEGRVRLGNNLTLNRVGTEEL